MPEKAMATHSSTLAWKIPWTEEPGKLKSMGSWRVGHNWATSLSRIGEGNGNPLQCSCLENPRDSRASWDAVCGVTQSRTWLKRLSIHICTYMKKCLKNVWCTDMFSLSGVLNSLQNQIFFWGNFYSAYRTSLSFSCSASLLETDSFSFCQSKNVFYFWRIYTLDIEFGVGRDFFFFQHLMISCQYLLATISDEKLVVIIISLFEISPLTHSFEAPFAFKIFCFYLFSAIWL